MQNNYNSQNIKVLKGLEAVRVRPGMYIGNTDDGSGLHHMIYELTDNSVDEALAGFCSYIKIKLYPDGSASVEDNGRGIPVDIHAEEGVSAAQVIMTQLHAGGKFDNDTYKVSGGLHGVGVSVVNALSAWLELIIVRDKKYYFMRFLQGQAQSPLQEINLNDYVSLGESDPKLIDELSDKKSGTYIRFTPDTTIFSFTKFNLNTLKKRYKELAFLNPKLTFELQDESTKEIFYDEGGVKSFVKMNAKGQQLIFDEPFSCKVEKNGIELDIALLWSSSAYDDSTLCFTNNIPQKEGGTHLQGFRTGLTKALQKIIPENKIKGLNYSGEDAREGLFAVISAKVPNPRFASQTKEKLVSTEVRPVTEQAIHDSLSRWLEENPHYTKLIVERILESIRAKEAARKARELVRTVKTPDIGLSVAGKLADCASKDPAIRELFLVEGQSAGGTAKMARNRNTQAVLALKGKLLNVEKAILAKILQYEEVRLIITVLGVGINEECLATDCKYHKIIIMTDADVDGSHIRTLLLTLFFRYMKPLIDSGYVYVSRPPLYAIKSKKHPTVYLKDDKELEQYVVEHTGKIISIYTSNDLLPTADKEQLYLTALVAAKELEQFGALKEHFLASKTVLNYNAQIFEDYLNSIFTNAKVSVIDDLGEQNDEKTVENDEKNHNKHAKKPLIWQITFAQYDRVFEYKLILKPISQAVKILIENWQPLQVNVHSKVYNIQTLIEFNNLMEKLQANAFDISRFKGLGEMNPKELRETGIDPTTRIIEQVNIESFDDTDYMVKLLMGDDVPLRRKFIEDNALNAFVDM